MHKRVITDTFHLLPYSQKTIIHGQTFHFYQQKQSFMDKHSIFNPPPPKPSLMDKRPLFVCCPPPPPPLLLDYWVQFGMGMRTPHYFGDGEFKNTCFGTILVGWWWVLGLTKAQEWPKIGHGITAVRSPENCLKLK